VSERVLYVRTDGLGDVLLSGPAVRAVAASGAEVTLLSGPAGAQVGSRLPGVADVMRARLPWIDAGSRPATRAWADALVAELGARRFDTAIIATSFHQSPLPTALLLRLAGVGRIGAISVDYPGALLDVRHAVDDDLHEVERALSLAGAMGYTLAPHDAGELRLTDAPAGRDGGYVVVHPGASVPARTWSADRWRALVATLVEYGYRPVVTGGPGERRLTAAVAGAAKQARDLGGTAELDELLDVIAGADAVVAGNTGPAHLAAALGTPVVSIFAPTVPACRWHPWRVPYVLLGTQTIGCAGCRARVCPRPGHPCLASVTPEDVVVALRWLGGTAPDRIADRTVPGGPR
jgi:ADP-heptose:LPS heptosyltransferase